MTIRQSNQQTDRPTGKGSAQKVAQEPVNEDASGTDSGKHDRAHLLGEFIREQRRVASLSLRKLSDMADISNPYLSQIERGLRKPSAEILQQLARALRISAETLYVQAGILDEKTNTPDLADAIWDDPSLSDGQKRALVQILRSFQAENRAEVGSSGTSFDRAPAERKTAEKPAGPSRAKSAKRTTSNNSILSREQPS